MTGILDKVKTGETPKKRRVCYFIRHAETAMNDKDVARGWTDVPLDDDTYSGLIELGESLKNLDGIMASDLLRTLQTAHCISFGSGAPILQTTAFLHTWNVGEFTGKPTKEVDPILEKMAVDEPYKTIKDGESFEEFKYRFLLGVIGALNSHPNQLIGFVTHGRCLAILNAWREAGFNSELEVDNDYLGYDEYEPGTAHLFEITCDLLR